MKESGKKLVFVYNANSGYLSAAIDAMHKTFKPDTYQCQLCALTYGSVKMKKEWKDFIKRLPYPAEFLHRDEFEAQYPSADVQFPSVHCDADGELTELISAKEFKSITELEQLMKRTEQAVAEIEKF